MLSKAAIDMLFASIHERNENSPSSTYKDVPDLIHILDLLETADDSKDDLELSYYSYAGVACRYEAMGRFSIAAKHLLSALLIARKMKESGYGLPDKVDTVFSNLLRDRNFYVDDDCEDARLLALELLPEEEVNRIHASRMARRRTLKADPVEMSEEYLAVIDEVEAKIDENIGENVRGLCHAIWALKEQYLAEKGILWRSPAMMNPRVHFD